MPYTPKRSYASGDCLVAKYGRQRYVMIHARVESGDGFAWEATSFGVSGKQTAKSVTVAERTLDNHFIQNSVECLNCGRVIFSRHRHDFRWCSCEDEQKRIAVDGGRDYLKFVSSPGAKFRWIRDRLPDGGFVEVEK